MHINVHEFKCLSDVNIVDLRSVEKYNSSHIPDAVNIPFEKLLVNPYDYIDKNLRYYLYCQHGLTSKRVCSILSKLGFNVINIDGGFEEWLFNN